MFVREGDPIKMLPDRTIYDELIKDESTILKYFNTLSANVFLSVLTGEVEIFIRYGDMERSYNFKHSN